MIIRNEFILFILNDYKGDASNDYEDRNSNPVLQDDENAKFYEWQGQWRVNDDSADSDQNM
jgi:hypothetical protein